eukprot:tig00001286_g8029.t1
MHVQSIGASSLSSKEHERLNEFRGSAVALLASIGSGNTDAWVVKEEREEVGDYGSVKSWIIARAASRGGQPTATAYIEDFVLPTSEATFMRFVSGPTFVKEICPTIVSQTTLVELGGRDKLVHLVNESLWPFPRRCITALNTTGVYEHPAASGGRRESYWYLGWSGDLALELPCCAVSPEATHGAVFFSAIGGTEGDADARSSIRVRLVLLKGNTPMGTLLSLLPQSLVTSLRDKFVMLMVTRSGRRMRAWCGSGRPEDPATGQVFANSSELANITNALASMSFSSAPPAPPLREWAIRAHECAAGDVEKVLPPLTGASMTSRSSRSCSSSPAGSPSERSRTPKRHTPLAAPGEPATAPPAPLAPPLSNLAAAAAPQRRAEDARTRGRALPTPAPWPPRPRGPPPPPRPALPGGLRQRGRDGEGVSLPGLPDELLLAVLAHLPAPISPPPPARWAGLASSDALWRSLYLRRPPPPAPPRPAPFPTPRAFPQALGCTPDTVSVEVSGAFRRQATASSSAGSTPMRADSPELAAPGARGHALPRRRPAAVCPRAGFRRRHLSECNWRAGRCEVTAARAHGRAVRAVEFLDPATFRQGSALSASVDGTVKVFELRRMQCLQTVPSTRTALVAMFLRRDRLYFAYKGPPRRAPLPPPARAAEARGRRGGGGLGPRLGDIEYKFGRGGSSPRSPAPPPPPARARASPSSSPTPSSPPSAPTPPPASTAYPLCGASSPPSAPLVPDVVLSGHAGRVTAVSLASEPSLHPCPVVTGGIEGLIKTWDVETGRCTGTWAGHSAGVQQLRQEGALLQSAGRDRTVRVFDTRLPARSACVLRLGHGAKVTRFDAVRGAMIVSATDDCALHAFDVRTGAALQRFSGVLEAPVTALRATSYELLTGCRDGSLYMWSFDPFFIRVPGPGGAPRLPPDVTWPAAPGL